MAKHKTPGAGKSAMRRSQAAAAATRDLQQYSKEEEIGRETDTANVRLRRIAATLKKKDAQFIGSLRSSTELALDMGEMLILAKKLVRQEGDSWEDWVEKHFPRSLRTAQVWMRLAAHRQQLTHDGKAQLPALIEHALAVIKTPKPVAKPAAEPVVGRSDPVYHPVSPDDPDDAVSVDAEPTVVADDPTDTTKRIKRMIRQLEEFNDEHGPYEGLDGFIGKACSHVTRAIDLLNERLAHGVADTETAFGNVR